MNRSEIDFTEIEPFATDGQNLAYKVGTMKVPAGHVTIVLLSEELPTAIPEKDSDLFTYESLLTMSPYSNWRRIRGKSGN